MDLIISVLTSLNFYFEKLSGKLGTYRFTVLSTEALCHSDKSDSHFAFEVSLQA